MRSGQEADAGGCITPPPPVLPEELPMTEKRPRQASAGVSQAPRPELSFPQTGSISPGNLFKEGNVFLSSLNFTNVDLCLLLHVAYYYYYYYF